MVGAKDVYLPKVIPYFINNNIFIIDIDAGASHNLAVDIDGNVYSWGSNERSMWCLS